MQKKPRKNKLKHNEIGHIQGVSTNKTERIRGKNTCVFLAFGTRLVFQIFFKKIRKNGDKVLRMDRYIQKQMNQTVFQINNVTMLEEKIYVKKINLKKIRQNQLKYL